MPAAVPTLRISASNPNSHMLALKRAFAEGENTIDLVALGPGVPVAVQVAQTLREQGILNVDKINTGYLPVETSRRGRDTALGISIVVTKSANYKPDAELLDSNVSGKSRLKPPRPEGEAGEGAQKSGGGASPSQAASASPAGSK